MRWKCRTWEASTGAELPRFIKDEFDAFLDSGTLTHGFLRLRCGELGCDKMLAFSCKRRRFYPSCGARRMSQTAVNLVDHVISHVPVRQWALSLPIPLRVLLAAQPELVTPVLQVVQRVVTRHPLEAVGLKADECQGGDVTLIRAREMIPRQTTRDGAELEVPGIVPKLLATPGRVRSPAPGLGDDTDAVQAELGFAGAEIAGLRERQVVA